MNRSWKVLVIVALLLAATGWALSAALYSHRQDVTAVLCRTVNQDRKALRVLIVKGAKGTRAFEELFRDVGAPGFKKRLKAARKDAQTLPRLRCRTLESQVGPF